VPKSHTSNNLAKGQFDKRDFRYIRRRDEYRCPADQRAIWRYSRVENEMIQHRYWASACPRCPMKAQCTTGNYRRVTRCEHEAVLEAMQARPERMPEAARIRRITDGTETLISDKPPHLLLKHRGFYTAWVRSGHSSRAIVSDRANSGYTSAPPSFPVCVIGADCPDKKLRIV
jgi:hypothetical protein